MPFGLKEPSGATAPALLAPQPTTGINSIGNLVTVVAWALLMTSARKRTHFDAMLVAASLVKAMASPNTICITSGRNAETL